MGTVSSLMVQLVCGGEVLVWFGGSFLVVVVALFLLWLGCGSSVFTIYGNRAVYKVVCQATCSCSCGCSWCLCMAVSPQRSIDISIVGILFLMLFHDKSNGILVAIGFDIADNGTIGRGARGIASRLNAQRGIGIGRSFPNLVEPRFLLGCRCGGRRGRGKVTGSLSMRNCYDHIMTGILSLSTGTLDLSFPSHTNRLVKTTGARSHTMHALIGGNIGIETGPTVTVATRHIVHLQQGGIVTGFMSPTGNAQIVAQRRILTGLTTQTIDGGAAGNGPILTGLCRDTPNNVNRRIVRNAPTQQGFFRIRGQRQGDSSIVLQTTFSSRLRNNNQWKKKHKNRRPQTWCPVSVVVQGESLAEMRIPSCCGCRRRRVIMWFVSCHDSTEDRMNLADAFHGKRRQARRENERDASRLFFGDPNVVVALIQARRKEEINGWFGVRTALEKISATIALDSSGLT